VHIYIYIYSTGLKRGNALLPFLFNFALQHVISMIQVKQGGTQLPVIADSVNLLGDSMHIINKITEA